MPGERGGPAETRERSTVKEGDLALCGSENNTEEKERRVSEWTAL